MLYFVETVLILEYVLNWQRKITFDKYIKIFIVHIVYM